MTKTLAWLLILSLISNSQIALSNDSAENTLEQFTPQYQDVDKCETPAPMLSNGCRCFSPHKLRVIANGLTDLEACRLALEAKDNLIEARLMAPTEPFRGIAWWQEPAVIIGGVVLTASVASLLTFLVVSGQ